MMKTLRKLLRSRKGATAVEYGLILALIIVAIMVAMSQVGTKTSLMWNNVATTVLSN